MRSAKELYLTRRGELAFIIGTGPSLKHAERHLMVPHEGVFRVALNRAIQVIPAEYWLWIDGDAYQESKDHPNAKGAIKIGVEHFRKLYEEDVYIWERVLSDMEGDLKEGKLVHRATSLIAAISMTMRLGAFRAVTVGTDNWVSQKFIDLRNKLDPTKKWGNVYAFTFARISEALKKRDKWLPKGFLLADASWDKSRLEWGRLRLPKTRIPHELSRFEEFKEWQRSWKRESAVLS